LDLQWYVRNHVLVVEGWNCFPVAVKPGPSSSAGAASGAAPAASAAALRYAWMAAHVHDVSTACFADFTETELGVRLNWKRAWRAVEGIEEQSRWRNKKGSEPATPSPGARTQAPVMRPWIVTDETALGLQRVLFRLPNDGLPRPALLAALETLPGIRQLIEVSSDREVIVVAVVRDLDEARDLRALLEDHAPGQPVRMDLITVESHLPTRLTWIQLARHQLKLDRGA
jgi:hypothetical protein